MSTPNENTNPVDIDPAAQTVLEASQYTRQASWVEGERIKSGTGKVLLSTGNKG